MCYYIYTLLSFVKLIGLVSQRSEDVVVLFIITTHKNLQLSTMWKKICGLHMPNFKFRCSSHNALPAYIWVCNLHDALATHFA
jgi:hypothetical protein